MTSDENENVAADTVCGRPIKSSFGRVHETGGGGETRKKKRVMLPWVRYIIITYKFELTYYIKYRSPMTIETLDNVLFRIIMYANGCVVRVCVYFSRAEHALFVL